jgi:SAM-dependent methyltransferase
MIASRCCICDTPDADVIAEGADYEYHISGDRFKVVRCRHCGLIYLNPRPDPSEHSRIYPPTYHAFGFTPSRYGLVYRVRRRLEARRLLPWCAGLSSGARILDVGCGDGFHLRLLRDFGDSGWSLEGVDASNQAVEAGAAQGLTIHRGRLEDLDLPDGSYDLVILIQTLEHLDDPPAVLRGIRRLLRPGGHLGIVTDNTASIDFRVLGNRYWGGFHFPRHWYLFSPSTLRRLCDKTGLEVVRLETQVSPINWVYSLRNRLVDRGAPRWIADRFRIEEPLTLAAFTLLDMACVVAGRGALLRAFVRRPLE